MTKVTQVIRTRAELESWFQLCDPPLFLDATLTRKLPRSLLSALPSHLPSRGHCHTCPRLPGPFVSLSGSVASGKLAARLCPPPIAALPMQCCCRSASSSTLCQDGGNALFICAPMGLMTAQARRRWGLCEPGTCAVPGPPSILSPPS